VDVAAWLRSLGLERYEEAFRDNEVDAGILPSLTADDLKDMGVAAVGHRRKLLDAIAALNGVAGGEPSGAAPSQPTTPPPTPPTTPPTAPQPARQARSEGERRQVTVLFCDLVGYTAMSRELDAEDVHRVLEGFFDLADRAVVEHGGTVDKHIGDCVMAVFGAPIAHGNDAERALRAALAIRDGVPAVAERVGRAIGVHVGVASGQVVASETGSADHLAYTVTGDSVNLASRLTDKAGRDQILISSAVQSALAERLDCSEVGSVEVKGFEQPIPVWRLNGFRDAAPDRRPLIGREPELAQFRAAIAGALDKQSGQAIQLRAEAGMGKTRLVEAFQDLAEAAGFVRHRGLVLDFGAGTGRDAIRVVARSLLGLGIDSGEEEARAASERALTDGLVQSDELILLSDLLELAMSAEQRALYEAMDNATRNRGKWRLMASLVRRSAAAAPQLVVVEDVHWADTLTLDCLAELTQATVDCAFLLVITSRKEGDPLDAAWRARLGRGVLATIELAPLGAAESRRLAQQAFGDAMSQLIEQCVERAAGNPLFLEQLLRHAAESTDGTTVPGSVQSLVQARVDRLTPPDKQAIQAASVLGQRFGKEPLRHLTEDPEQDCAALIEHLLVRREGDAFLFAHALIRDGVYDSLLRSRRRQLHGKAADWYGGAGDLSLRAEHLDRGGDAKAPAAYFAAAEAEAHAYHYERALRLLRRGLELASDPELRFDLASREGEMLRELGSTPASIEAFERALDLAQSDAQRCRAWIGLVSGMRVADRIDEALALLDRAEAVARALDLPAELTQIHYYRGSLFFPRGDIDGCIREHELALAFAGRAGLPEREALALSGIGDGYYAKGRMRTAHDTFQRCLALCDRHGLVRVEAANRFMVATVRIYLNEFRGGLEDAMASAELAARVGHQRAEIVSRLTAGWILIDLGELAAARDQAERGLAIARDLGAKRFEPFLAESIGRILLAEGDRGAAAEVLAQALAQTRELGALTFIGPWLLGTFARAVSDAAAREAALQEGAALLAGRCVGHNYCNFYRAAIEASLEAGDAEGAERYSAALEAYMAAEPVPWSSFFIRRGRALGRLLRGDRDPLLAGQIAELRAEAEAVELRSALPGLLAPAAAA
jgi:class 3 adenylate cyclase/tetratricopeptide (TPR) repeat protein